MRFLIRLLINMVAILLIAYFFPSIARVDSPWSALGAAFLLGIVNTLVRPILVILTLPLTILTLGLFLLVINGLMLGLVAALVGGFHINGFSGAFVGAIFISIISWILSRVFPS
jgi:putative membrane protein